MDRRQPPGVRPCPSPPRVDARLDKPGGRGPASRPGKVSYDSALGRYYSAFPEGLRTRKGSGTQVTPYILWEEIPAWVQPGLTGSLRSRLLAGVPGRDKDEPGSLREALDAAWAAIEAAPPPSPAELDDARHVYRGASPAQPTLFSDPPPDGKNMPRSAKASPAQDETPGTAADSAQGQPDTGPGRRQHGNPDEPRRASTAGRRRERHPGTPGRSQPGTGPRQPRAQPGRRRRHR